MPHIIPRYQILYDHFLPVVLFFYADFSRQFSNALSMYRPISVLNVSCPHAVAHPYLAVVMLTIYLYLRSPSVSILQASPCVCFLADQFLPCVYVHVLSLPLAIT